MQKVYISAESLLRDSMQLGMQIMRSDFRPTFLAALWRGGAPIGITVQEVLEYHGVQCDHIAIRTSAYTDIDKQSKSVRVHAVDYLVSQLNADDQLLLIDDVFDSGSSMQAVVNELQRRCRRNFPERFRTATVYYKPTRNRTSLCPDFYVRTTEDWLVFPHEVQGLTRAEILANKPVDASFFLD